MRRFLEYLGTWLLLLCLAVLGAFLLWHGLNPRFY